jgi:hypothetical protein
VRILFAHPTDVAYADQAAAALPATLVRLRKLVCPGRMYLIKEEKAKEIRYGFELEWVAEEVIAINTARLPK